MTELWSKIYLHTKVPLTPIYGGFPVKLRTYLGDPIPSWNFEVEELRLETIAKIQDLINEHQQVPGNVVRAIKERLEDDLEDIINDEIESIETEIEAIEDNTEAVDDFQSVESLCNFDDLLTDSGCGSVTSDKDYECLDISDISPVPVIKLPNGKLVLSVVRRLSSYMGMGSVLHKGGKTLTMAGRQGWG